MLEELMALGTPGGGEALSCAALGARWGLMLSAAEAAELAEAQGEALRAEGRIAFSPGALTELVRAFAPSPYAERESWAALLAELLELFYHFKTLTRERIPDEALARAMAAIFNGPAGGQTELLAEAEAEALCRAAEAFL